MPNIVVAYIKEDKVAPYLEALAAVGVPESDIFRATPPPNLPIGVLTGATSARRPAARRCAPAGPSIITWR